MWGVVDFAHLWLIIILTITVTPNEGQEFDINSHPRLFAPQAGVVVDAFCKWEVRLNIVQNRIPQSITEVHCINPRATCAWNSQFKVSI